MELSSVILLESNSEQKSRTVGHGGPVVSLGIARVSYSSSGRRRTVTTYKKVIMCVGNIS